MSSSSSYPHSSLSLDPINTPTLNEAKAEAAQQHPSKETFEKRKQDQRGSCFGSFLFRPFIGFTQTSPKYSFPVPPPLAVGDNLHAPQMVTRKVTIFIPIRTEGQPKSMTTQELLSRSSKFGEPFLLNTLDNYYLDGSRGRS